jgi:assimilatory nitrate reductase electron transfer subunit
MTGRKRLVIVGNGMASTRLVEELVARGSDWQITVLGDEPHPPYNRILLSAVLEGTHRPEALTLRGEEWYAEHGVDLRLGARVLEVERDLKDVMLVDGTIIEYDALVLATGSIPTLPPIRGLVKMDGSLHESVHAFRSLHDCQRLLEAISGSRDGRRATSSTNDGQRAVVVGGGLLGLQVARALGVRGLDTEIVEGGDHLLHQQIGGAAGGILARDLKKLGVAVYTGARAVRLSDGPDGRAALRLDTGFTLDTHLVILTAGGRPSTALARRAGLDVRRGIVVDDRLASVTDPDIFALGDCVEHDHRVTGFVPPAWEQAGVLARVLTDKPAKYDGSRIVARLRATGLDVAVLGDPEQEVRGGGEVVEMSNPVRGSHRKLVIRDRRIVAGALVGDLNRIGLITQHYDRQTVLGPREPGDLLLVERSTRPAQLPEDAEICSCAGVTVGAIRACSSFEDARETTRATTGCGGCATAVRELLTATMQRQGERT